jgi:8-oxo-dGTP pyrophosphatase MutT (NUDIX family)
MSQSENFPDAFYRVTIKGLYVEDGKLMLIKESNTLTDGWELPGGGLDFGEDIHTTFVREVKEEMGLTVIKMSKAPLYTWTYKYENRRSLKWFYTCVLAYRVEFSDLNFTPTPECEELKFVTPEELANIDFRGQIAGLPPLFDINDFAEPL